MNTPIRMSAIVLFNQQRVRDRQKREQLTEAFRKADKNGDGRLSVEEIHGIYTAHGVDVTREDVQKIVDAADKDGTGLLTEKEFVNSQAVGDVSKNINVTVFENHPKCLIWIQIDPIFGIFNEFMFTQNVNVARFARNVEWDFWWNSKHCER